jgi:release factor glutamine methyltransferase
MVREGQLSLNENLRIDAALEAATEQLRASSDSPRLDAELLLARALDVQRSYLFAHPDDEMDASAARRFQSAVQQRSDGMPMAYIAGEKEFWSLNLIVSPATLVPRPDTELLVDQALTRIPRKADWQIADLGTGSGAIALALARERPLCQLTATDLSGDALVVARENARQLSLPNIEFLHGDWTAPIAGREFDLIVSNPPYIASNDPHLANLRHEPRSALDAGEDGLDAIRELATSVGDILRSGGHLLLEHGDQQATAVANVLRLNGWLDIRTFNDIEGRPRVTAATSP